MFRVITVWLWTLCALVAAMVVVGGVTRLTGSGLSIVEWAPLSGAVPPLGHEAWQDAFARYRASPEGRLVHPGISLEHFRALFLVEWAHRLLARVLGLALVVPWFVLARRGAVDPALHRRLVLVASLAGSQAVMGWAMVKSGLVEVPHVSPYRLVAHLLLAFAVFAVLFVTTLERAAVTLVVPPRVAWSARALVGLAALTAASGGAMAGTHGGLLFPTFPDMNGSWAPAGIFARGPRAALEDPLTAHFDHRLLASVLAMSVLAFAWHARGTQVGARAQVLVAALVVQVALGAATVLHHVPIALAVAHQLGGLTLFAATLYVAGGYLRPVPRAHNPSPPRVELGAWRSDRVP